MPAAPPVGTPPALAAYHAGSAGGVVATAPSLPRVRADAAEVTGRYPSTRPLIFDSGQPVACVLVHDPNGVDVSGFDVGQITDSELATTSRLGHLLEPVREERLSSAAELGERDVLAVGVRRWHLQANNDATTVTLELDRVPLSHWIASRNVFSRLDENERIDHTRDHALGVDPLFGTHLGYTATVVTSDEQLVVVRRTAKLLADGLLDSAIGDTATVGDLDSSGRLDATSLITTAGRRYLGLETGQLSLRIALLGVRVVDAGIWISGHARTPLTVTELREAVIEHSDHPDPDRLVFIPWDETATERAAALGQWTPWGLADLASAHAVDFGGTLQDWTWVSLP